jgi:uncharacterized membrane protein YeaQ/YmgE (transglycosylase-associated protein family)
MNTKTIIAAVVGGIILFFWQFLSNAAINIHAVNQKHTPNQSQVIECLNANLTEDGSYFIPMPAPGATSEEQEAHMKANNGKPWARIQYFKSFETNMAMNMVRGVLADIVAVMLLIFFVFPNFKSINIKNTILATVGAALTMYLTVSYGEAIWYKTNTIPELIDVFGGWILTGAWLGWYLRRD